MALPNLTIQNPETGEHISLQMSIQATDAASATKSEAFAVGERNGVPVESGDPTYQNNAKYYAGRMQEIIDEAQTEGYINVVTAVADAYSALKTYNVGEYSIHDGKLYRCIVKITTPEAWTDAHWEQATIGEEIGVTNATLEGVAAGKISFDFTEYETIKCTVSANNTAQRADDRYQSIQIPIVDGVYKEVTFVGNASKAGVITFLKKPIPSTISNGTSATEYFATGETERHLVNAGVTATFTVPSDARYLFISSVSNSVSVIPVEVTAITGAAEKIDAVKDDVNNAYVMLSESRDILAPYARTAEFMRADGTLTAATDERLYKYTLGYSVLDNTIYLNGKGTFSRNANPYCYLWFMQNGALMSGQYIQALANPVYFDMQAITVPSGADEVWVDRTIKVFTRTQTVPCEERLGGIEKFMAADSIADPMPLDYTTTTKLYIQYDTGIADANNDIAITNYVPVGGYKTIKYGRIAFSDSAETNIGIAFYDKNKKYISGQAAITGAESLAHVPTEIDVPSGACFVRCSIRRYLAGFVLSGTSCFVRVLANASALVDATGAQWRRKSWYAYGTSLTTEAQGHYANHVASLSGMTLTNRGYGGGGMVTNPQIYQRLKDMTDGKLDADLITIECGANDGAAPIGDPASYDTTTVCGALNDAIKYMFDNGIKAQVVLMCSYPSRYKANDPTTRFDVTSAREGGGTWLDLCDAIRKVAMANGLYYISFNGVGMGRARGNGMYGDLYVADNIHPTELGGYNVALGVWYQLRNIPVFYNSMPT